MNMGFGIYKGKPVAWVLLEDSQYFKWMDSTEQARRPEFIFTMHLIKVFDELPFKNKDCLSCKGKNPVTRLAIYNQEYNGTYWFCDKCDPYSNGAMSGKLAYISKLAQVAGYKSNQTIIKAMAIAKGVPQRKTEKSLKEFFGY